MLHTTITTYYYGTETVQVTPLRITLASFPNPNALVAFSKVMQAVKLCCNEILQCWLMQIVLQKGHKMVSCSSGSGSGSGYMLPLLALASWYKGSSAPCLRSLWWTKKDKSIE